MYFIMAFNLCKYYPELKDMFFSGSDSALSHGFSSFPALEGREGRRKVCKKESWEEIVAVILRQKIDKYQTVRRQLQTALEK